MSDALIGKQLNNFRIERLLGRGGMAQVYYGTDVGLNRPVAIKVIDERWREDEQFTARFISEAQTIATWRHDNIIQVYYAGNEDDLYYFVMEYIDGEDLTDYMYIRHHKGELIPYENVISILQATASGLDYAHSKGVIHRDVKPSNIMMGSDNRVVLMDFGLALDIQKGTIGESFGTPHYIAPEQAQDASTAVAQSDQYALGVIAYELLTGQVPFDNPSAMNVAIMHMTEVPPNPSTINPKLTADVEHVLLKVLSKKSGQRFPSCQAFIETLEHAIAGRPTLIDDVSPSEIDKILITPPTINPIETLVDSTPSNEVRKDQPPAQTTQPSNTRRTPLALIAVGVCAIIAIGILVALGGNNSSDAEPTATIIAQVIDIVTETPIATDDPPLAVDQPTITSIPATETILPPNTDSPPTTTELPTQTDSPATSTELPTNIIIPASPTDIATDTAVPATVIPITDLPVAVPTVAYPNGSPIILYYNDSSFYVWNPTSGRIQTASFKFEALDNDGNTLSHEFDGTRWTQFYSFLDGGNCVAIEMTAGDHLKPSECSNYNSVVNSTSDSDLIFWTGQSRISGFRVSWQDEEVARCDTIAGECRFNIP